MESDNHVVKTGSGTDQVEEFGPSTNETVSARRCFGITPASQSSAVASWSVASLEHQRPAHLHPAASAVQLVPDIVVEHVFSDTGTSHQPLSVCTGLAPDVLGAYVSSGRPLRALSDSSVYKLERFRHSSVVGVLTDARRRATCPVASSASLDQFTSSGRTGSSDHAPPELEMDVFTPECSRESFGSTQMLSSVPVGWPVSSLVWQPSLPSPQSLHPERSPKANWLRRHSDSNLTSGHSRQTGLRVEPYPIRSRSTGDTLMNMASLQGQQVSCVAGDSLSRPPKEPVLSRQRSELQHPTSPSHLWSAAGRIWHERASPTARKFFSEGSKQPVTLLEEQLSERSCSENISSRELLSRSEETSSAKRQTPTCVPVLEGVALTAMTTEQSDVVNLSTLERSAAVEKTKGLVEKRLKLKKYLQTRYQMSQDRLLQSSDTDDVFMERGCTPDSSVPVVTPAAEPTDLSMRPHSIPATKSTSETNREEDQGIGGYVAVTTAPQEPRDSRTFHSSTEHSQFQQSSDELPMLVKREPASPGIVPSGTSVFVFPPALPSHHEPTDWYPPVCRHHSASPVSSPLSSGVPESYHHFPGFFRHPSCPGDNGSYHAARLRMVQQQAAPTSSDVGICRRRACSLAISTDVSSLTLSEVRPSTPPQRFAVAGPEVLYTSLPAAHQSLTEPVHHRSPFSSHWHRHYLRGRHLSSSVEDPAMFTCPVCSAVLPSYQHLTDHMADHVTSSPPAPPPDAGEPSELEAAGLDAGGGGKVVHLCPICQRSFSRGDMLTRHVRLHTGVRPYECSLCSQVTVISTNIVLRTDRWCFIVITDLLCCLLQVRI